MRWQPVLLFALGLGLGAMGQRKADAGGGCPLEDQCSIKKPNFMVVLDYSSAMNETFDASTRWDAAVDAVQGLLITQNGYFDDNMHFGLVRFGHDPDPAVAGTTIPGDSTACRASVNAASPGSTPQRP